MSGMHQSGAAPDPGAAYPAGAAALAMGEELDRITGEPDGKVIYPISAPISKTGGVVGAYISSSDDERDLILISKKGIVIRVPFKSVPSLGRDTQGVRIMRFKEEGDSVSSVTFISKDEADAKE